MPGSGVKSKYRARRDGKRLASVCVAMAQRMKTREISDAEWSRGATPKTKSRADGDWGLGVE